MSKNKPDTVKCSIYDKVYDNIFGNKMKIALVIKDYSLKKGGMERYVVNLSKELKKMGHEVHVLANYRDKTDDPEICFHKISIIRFGFFIKNLSFAKNCRKVLKKDKYDIINGFSRTYPLDVYRIGHKIRRHLLQVQFSNRFLRMLKYFSIRHLTILYLERQIFKKENHKKIIANSNLGKKHANIYHHIPEDKIEVIYNGVDLNKFNLETRKLYRNELRSEYQFDEDETVLLFVGRNFKLKGVKTIIKSIAILGQKNKNIKVLIAGKGNPSAYQRIAKKHGIEKKIIFAGEHSHIEKFYAAGDIFVFPTLYDPFANVCLEAMACGLPVITTLMNGAAEIIEEGKNGYVMKDYQSAHELADKISAIISGGSIKEMGKYAFETAKKFTTAENAKRVETLYKKILK